MRRCFLTFLPIRASGSVSDTKSANAFSPMVEALSSPEFQNSICMSSTLPLPERRVEHSRFLADPQANSLAARSLAGLLVFLLLTAAAAASKPAKPFSNLLRKRKQLRDFLWDRTHLEESEWSPFDVVAVQSNCGVNHQRESFCA